MLNDIFEKGMMVARFYFDFYPSKLDKHFCEYCDKIYHKILKYMRKKLSYKVER